MRDSLFSPSWYRVAQLKPRLRGHIQLHRHQYRGECWYVLQDHLTGRYARFSPGAYAFIGGMDGARTVEALWERALERLDEVAPTQGEIVNLLSQLHALDALVCDVTPDTAELFNRYQTEESRKWKQNLFSPLSMKFTLVDPERFLTRTVRWVRPLFTPMGLAVWSALTGTALALAARHWPELTGNLADRVLSAENLLLIWLLFPFLKAIHELAHGYAVKVWGGEVHEMGIMLLVLMPIPFVNASAALAFRERARRVMVGAAGILAETAVASVALFLWIHLEPGNLRAVAYNVVLIAGVTTIFFNANPLLRYDGYYILSDLLEIPNLSQRGLKYVGYLIQHYLFGVDTVERPLTSPGEPFWLVTFTIASGIYRIFVYTAIILFISQKFYGIGLILAAWAVIMMGIVPVSRMLGFVMFHSALREKRPRSVLATLGMIAAGLALLFIVPFPSWTRAEGVIWIPEDSLVRAEVNGFVREIRRLPNEKVQKGDVLILCEDPILEARREVLLAKKSELLAQYDGVILQDRVQAHLLQEELRALNANLEWIEELIGDLTIRSPAPGTFIVPEGDDLPGRFLRKGQLVAYVLPEILPAVRVAVPQAKADWVRYRTRKVEVRLAGYIHTVISAGIKQEIPGAVDRLPSPVLSHQGGGPFALDPTAPGGLKTLEPVFLFDLELENIPGEVWVGTRVLVRFDHGFEPLGFQGYRYARQLFLKRFNV